jgi:heme exporter protein C
MIVLLFILPRMTDSLHPGNGGNPAFGQYDLDSTMRLVFYPACLGWILAGLWIATLFYRLRLVKLKRLED